MQQIADWLKQLGMPEHIQCFAKHDIDFTILGDLTDQDLEKIGVTSLGHRRKLLSAISQLKGAPAAPLRLRHLRHRERRTLPSAGKSR